MKIKVGKPISANKDGLDKSALHEAGHVVVAKSFGCIVKSTVIDVGSGLSIIDSPKSNNVDNIAWAIIACAGSVSEGVNWINDGDFSIVKESGFSEKDLSLLFEITKKICDKYRDKIELFSKELLKRKKINKKQIDKYGFMTFNGV